MVKLRLGNDRGSVTAELALALPTVALIIFVTLGAFSLQIEKMKLVSVAGSVARAIARGEVEAVARQLAQDMRPGTQFDLTFEPTVVCAKAFFDLKLEFLGGQSIQIADYQCARTSGL